MRTNFKSWIAILSLAATSVVTVATSKKGDYPTPDPSTMAAMGTRYYYVNSDCPGALPRDQITVTDGNITYPPNRRFADFGLPLLMITSVMTPQVTGQIRGYQLVCNHSTMAIPTGTHVLDAYDCLENGQPICRVEFEEAVSNQSPF